MRTRCPETPPPGHLAIAGSRGFSLIEVVLALGIISFAIVGIIGMMPVAMKSAGDSMRETDGTLIARGIFAAIQSGDGAVRWVPGVAGGVNLAASGTTAEIPYRSDGVPGDDVEGYIARVVVDANTGQSGLSRVQVDVSSPPAAPAERRTTNSFVTLVGF